MQIQMRLTDTHFCEFVVWTKKNFYQRITRTDVFWVRESARAEKFFFRAILPELLGKFFTNKKPAAIPEAETMEIGPSTSNVQGTVASSNLKEDERLPDLWCYCRMPDDGTKMVLCENQRCKNQWFHRICIDLTKLPRGKWFCKDCVQGDDM